MRPSLIYIHTCLFFITTVWQKYCSAARYICDNEAFANLAKISRMRIKSWFTALSLSSLSLIDASNTWYLLSWFSLQVQVSYTLKDGRKMLRTISKSLSTTDCREAMEEVCINQSAEYTCRYPLAIIIYLPVQSGTISMLMHASVLQKNYFILQRTLKKSKLYKQYWFGQINTHDNSVNVCSLNGIIFTIHYERQMDRQHVPL